MHAHPDDLRISAPASAAAPRLPAVVRTIDATGSHCPGPLQELIRAVREAGIGETVAVITDDPAAHSNIPAWIAKAGYRLVAIENGARGSRFVVTRTR